MMETATMNRVSHAIIEAYKAKGFDDSYVLDMHQKFGAIDCPYEAFFAAVRHMDKDVFDVMLTKLGMPKKIAMPFSAKLEYNASKELPREISVTHEVLTELAKHVRHA